MTYTEKRIRSSTGMFMCTVQSRLPGKTPTAVSFIPKTKGADTQKRV